MRRLIMIALFGSLCATGCVLGESSDPAPAPQHTGGGGGGGGGIGIGSGSDPGGGVGSGSDPGNGGNGGGAGSGSDPGNSGGDDNSCDVSVNGDEVLCTGNGNAVTCECLVNGTLDHTCTPSDPSSPCNFGVPGDSNCCGY